MAYKDYSEPGIGFWRLVAAIVLALLIVSGIETVVGAVYTRWVANHMAQSIEKMSAQAKRDAQEREIAAAQARLHKQVQDQEMQDRHRRAMLLLPEQKCVGGTVVSQTLQSNGSYAYVQLLEKGQPVPCLGDHRLSHKIKSTTTSEKAS